MSDIMPRIYQCPDCFIITSSEGVCPYCGSGNKKTDITDWDEDEEESCQ